MFIKKSETLAALLTWFFYDYLIRKYHKLLGYKFVDEIKKNQSGDSIAKEKLKDVK